MIALKHGLVSLKTLSLRKDKKFYVINHIDDSRQVLDTKGLKTHSNIAEAIKKGGFYWATE